MFEKSYFHKIDKKAYYFFCLENQLSWNSGCYFVLHFENKSDTLDLPFFTFISIFPLRVSNGLFIFKGYILNFQDFTQNHGVKD